MNDSVKKLLKESMWDLATCANGEPNVVPVAFKDVTPDGKLAVGDVFLDTTLKNLAANGAITWRAQEKGKKESRKAPRKALQNER